MAADRKTLALIGLALLLLVLNGALFVVKETERAIMLQFGRIVDADIPPGLHIKLPIVHQIKKFDARVLTVDGEPESFFTIERKRLIVDSFAKWRISDVQTYYKATGGVENITRTQVSVSVGQAFLPGSLQRYHLRTASTTACATSSAPAPCTRWCPANAIG